MIVNPYFLAMEIVTFGLLALCLWHAWNVGPQAVMRLAAGLVFGVMLELATIRQLNAYEYGRFAIMVLDVPLAIGVGWTVIIYSAQLFSDATTLPQWAKPLLDSLLALSIDLSMDAIAIRLGMWDWGRGLQIQFFGVPYANFWAWLWVVFFFSAGTRWLTRLLRGRWQVLAPIGAVVIGLAGVLGTNALITYAVPLDKRFAVVSLTIGAALGLVAAQRPRLARHDLGLPAAVVPFAFHLIFLMEGLISGVILQPPVLLGISLVMLGVSLALHLPPLWRWRLRPASVVLDPSE